MLEEAPKKVLNPSSPNRYWAIQVRRMFMNKHLLIALALSGALAISAAAQQTTTSQPSSTPPAASDQQQQRSQPAPAASTSSSDQTAAPAATPAETATGQAPLQVRKEGFWGHLNPFARKKYIQRQLNPVRDRLNELDQLTAANSKLIKDVDSRATEGIRLATAKANEADMHAVDAGNRAQLAHQTAEQANTRLTTVSKAVTNIDQFQAASQVEIRFRPGQRALSKKAKSALDDLATPLKDQKGYILEVQGFSSGRGESAIASSQLMADSVVRYLVLNNEIPVYRIYKVGMGNAPLPSDENGKAQRVHGGRVEISLLKNGIGDLQVEPTAPAVATGGGNQQAAPLPQSDQGSTGVGSSPNSGSSSSKPAPAPETKPAPEQQQPQQPQQTPPQK